MKVTSLWLIYWLEVLGSLQNVIFIILSAFTIVLVIYMDSMNLQKIQKKEKTSAY